MKIVSLRVNGNNIDGLDSASIKITLNNISPVTMTGDSVAFSATVEVPRTPNNDRTFIGLNKGLLNCEYYVAEVLIASIPFKYYAYVSDEPTQFYAKVSASQTEYTINLIESTDKWSDVSKPITTLPKFSLVKDGGVNLSAADLARIVREYVDFPQMTFPSINPFYNPGGLLPQPEDADVLTPTMVCAQGKLTWRDNVATGTVKFLPKGSTKGRGGYKYPDTAAVVLDNSQIYIYASLFGNRTGGGPAGFLISAGENQQFQMIVEYKGGAIPTTKPTIQLRGVVSGVGRSMSYYGSITDRIWIYVTENNAQMTVYPKQDAYMQLAATIGGVTRTDYFRFPDGYDPEELIRCGAGQAVFDEAIKPQFSTAENVAVGFPYTDVKNIVDDMCTAWHWRKIYRNGKLRVEPIVDADLRDGTSMAWARIHDWSDKLRSVETVDVPDEFADQYVCTIGSEKFSYNNGPGTVTPVKDAYKSSVKFSYNNRVFPIMGLTAVFAKPSNYYYTFVKSIYYPYINRHFDMFRSRVQVKIKAQLEYADVENLRLGDAYYFSQLNSCFYIKSLGEYDVATGNCKLSLYKMDLK
ncbi:hypothetical protein BK745P3_00013 [Bacteroides phage BK745P3]|nr:hypothetical protein BK745P3_00013 [Bacteroides phage BK745P3]